MEKIVMIYQEIDDVKFKMGRQFDFDFLKKYEKVFKVYDDQDSGNICFGIENKGRKIFVKFAGAQTAEYNGDVFGAIQRLKATVPIYQSIKQKSLIKYITSEEVGQGFAMVFEWADGECMGRMWGSSRFMSPEEYKYGEKIDEISNVFMIGKMGFSILTDSDLSFEHYPLSLGSFHVLEKATNPNRCERYASITEFKKHWLKVL